MHRRILIIGLLAGCTATRTERVRRPNVQSQHSQSLQEATSNPKAPTLVFTGATLMTAAGQEISGGTIISSSGAITYVGEDKPESTPLVVSGKQASETQRVLDVSGKFITPGLIDTHSHLGVYPLPYADAHGDGNEMVSPTTPYAKAEYGYWPQDPGIYRARAGGVTTALVLPGSANLIGGEGFTVVMKPGRYGREVGFPGAPRTLKMACGENPKRVYEKKGGPQTRMAEYALFRKAFAEAKAYANKKQSKNGKDKKAASAPDLAKEALAAVLRGDVLVQIHCYRSDDIMNMVAIADEMGFAIRSFHHALEAYKVRDILAKKKIAINTWADWWGFKMEAFDGIPQGAGLFANAGGRTVIHSDSAIGIQRLNQEAAKAMWAARHAGLEVSRQQALEWITKNAAWVLGLQDVIGTLEVGKRADYVVWSGDPLSVSARPELVIQAGEIVYDASKDNPVSDFELGNSERTREPSQ